jgi:hypothetical protein
MRDNTCEYGAHLWFRAVLTKKPQRGILPGGGYISVGFTVPLRKSRLEAAYRGYNAMLVLEPHWSRSYKLPVHQLVSRITRL